MCQKLYECYKCAISSMTLTTISNAVAVKCCTGWIPLIATGVGGPAGAALENLAVAGGGGGGGSDECSWVNPPQLGTQKHDQNHQVAATVLTTVREITS